MGVEILIGLGLLLLGGVAVGGCDSSEEKPDASANTGQECNSCHTGPSEIPTSDFKKYGVTETLGAHRFHLNPRYSNPITCSDCHPETNSVWDTPTHMNKVVDVTVPGYDALTESCTVYCHGETAMQWKVSNLEPTLTCSSCHTETNPPHDITNQTECSKCHDQTMNPDGTFKSKALHINQTVEKKDYTCDVCHGEPPTSHLDGIIDPSVIFMVTTCDNCHPQVTSPFRTSADDTHKNGEPTFKPDLCGSCHDYPPLTSGAHSAHLTPDLMSAMSCHNCHNEPTSADGLISHLNPAFWLPVVFRGFSATYQTSSAPRYDDTLKQCFNIFCHGVGLPEGQLLTPLNWFDTSGSAKACGACHSTPPPSSLTIHDPTDTDCSICHPMLPAKHVNGMIDVQ